MSVPETPKASDILDAITNKRCWWEVSKPPLSAQLANATAIARTLVDWDPNAVTVAAEGSRDLDARCDTTRKKINSFLTQSWEIQNALRDPNNRRACDVYKALPAERTVVGQRGFFVRKWALWVWFKMYFAAGIPTQGDLEGYLAAWDFDNDRPKSEPVALSVQPAGPAMCPAAAPAPTVVATIPVSSYRSLHVIAGSFVAVAIGGLGFWFSRESGPPPNLRLSPICNVKPVDTNRPESKRKWPDLSPDGKQVTYVRASEEDYSLCTCDLQSGQEQSLFTAKTALGPPKWSPDGKRILFSRSAVDARVDIMVTDWTPLPVVPKVAYSIPHSDREFLRWDNQWFSWNPSGRTICFAQRRDIGSPYRIYRAGLERDVLDSKHEPMTTPESIPGDTQCAWAPDGNQFAFVRQETGNTATLYHSTASDPSRINKVATAVKIEGIDWVDNERLLLAQNTGSVDQTLFLYRRDRPGLIQLHTPDLKTAYPAVSAGSAGGNVAAQRYSSEADIFYVDISEGKPTRNRLAGSNDLFEESPAISPDGRTLAFTVLIPANPSYRELWMSNPDGTGRRRVERGGDLSRDRSYVDSLRWSPDGRTLLFSGPRLNGIKGHKIWLLDLTTLQPRVLLGTDDTNEGRGAFSGDGKFVFLRSNRTAPEQIFRLPVSSARGPVPPELWTLNGAVEGFVHPTGTLYFAKAADGLFRQSHPGEKAELVLSGVAPGRWVLTDDAVIFLAARQGGGEAFYRLPLQGFSSFKPQLIDVQLGPVRDGLSATRDGSRIYFSEDTLGPSQIVYGVLSN